MNTNLILKSSGKEFVIINELVKEIKYSDGHTLVSLAH